jgi:hypothetical protein
MADVDFFWDPVCPWAWITSRWVTEVAGQRSLEVDWRFISLRMVNEEKYAAGTLPERAKAGHGMGRRLLRVAAAVRDREGPERIGDLYTALGTRIHLHQYDLGEKLYTEALAEVGLDPALADAAGSDAWDEALRTSHNAGMKPVGTDVGTPVIHAPGPEEGTTVAFFGPVVTPSPKGEAAGRLWDGVVLVAGTPGFYELKRTRDLGPIFE